MALSSDSMDNTFRARVQKIFGPFSSSSSSSSSSLSPPWSVIDDEVEKREWRRPSSAKDDDQTPISFSFDGLFTRNTRRQHDLQDINDYDDQLGGGRHSSEYVKGDGRDEWEIRSSIGLDSTLDNEVQEEEDEYDKVAEGRGIHSGCWCNTTSDRMLARLMILLPEGKCYVIPKGCFVVPFLSAVHLDENLYEGAITFNSWRWMDPLNQEKRNWRSSLFYAPFGGGARFCPGAELARLQIALFLHYFVTTYRCGPNSRRIRCLSFLQLD
ncbi:unnamed protein product [Camellia sinensis]